MVSIAGLRLVAAVVLVALFGSLGTAGQNLRPNLAKLTNQLYNDIVEQLGLKGDFQLTHGAPLGNTDEDVWNTFNGIPPKASSSVKSIGKLSDNYRGLLDCMTPLDTTDIQNQLGNGWPGFKTCYSDVSKSCLDCVRSGGIGNELKIKKFCQDISTSALAVATSNFDNADYWSTIDGIKVPKFSNGITYVKGQVNLGKQGVVLLDSSKDTSDTSHQYGSGSISGLFDFFWGRGDIKKYDKFSSTATSDSITMSIKIDLWKQIDLTTGPWFNQDLINRAYYAKDNNARVWNLAEDPTCKWDRFFGPTGSLTANVESIVVISGMSASITTAAKFNKNDQSELDTAASAGFWPFFHMDASATYKTSATVNANGGATFNIESTPGTYEILGIMVGNPSKPRGSALRAMNAFKTLPLPSLGVSSLDTIHSALTQLVSAAGPVFAHSISQHGCSAVACGLKAVKCGEEIVAAYNDHSKIGALLHCVSHDDICDCARCFPSSVEREIRTALSCPLSTIAISVDECAGIVMKSAMSTGVVNTVPSSQLEFCQKILQDYYISQRVAFNDSVVSVGGGRTVSATAYLPGTAMKVMATIPAGGALCDGFAVPHAQIESAVQTGYGRRNGPYLGTNKYPHYYGNYEGLDMRDCGSDRLLFPVVAGGYAGGQPGIYRVVFDKNNGEYCATIYHTNGNEFAECEEVAGFAAMEETKYEISHPKLNTAPHKETVVLRTTNRW